MIVRPRQLRPGDTIGVIGPASPMTETRLEKGVRYLEARGYRVQIGKHAHETYGYLAGTDAQRVEDINSMFQNPEIQAIFCTRGGYGTPRLLHLLNYTQIKSTPKILVGYSDITALQLAIFAKTSMVTFSGPMVAVEMGKGIDAFTEKHFWSALDPNHGVTRLTGLNSTLSAINGGIAEGQLLGGCLSIINTLVGTPYLPSLEGAILFLEDIGEEPYRIDRNLVQLRLSGVFEQIHGLVFGRFESCEPSPNSPSLTLQQIVEDLARDLSIPVVAGMPYGHVDVKYTLPLGIRCRLNADDGFLEFLEPAVLQ